MEFLTHVEEIRIHGGCWWSLTDEMWASVRNFSQLVCQFETAYNFIKDDKKTMRGKTLERTIGIASNLSHQVLRAMAR